MLSFNQQKTGLWNLIKVLYETLVSVFLRGSWSAQLSLAPRAEPLERTKPYGGDKVIHADFLYFKAQRQ